jgi:hypothetical protein
MRRRERELLDAFAAAEAEGEAVDEDE